MLELSQSILNQKSLSENGWYCSVYQNYNDITDEQCHYCDEQRPAALHFKALQVEIERRTKDYFMAKASDTSEHIDKYAEFFNHATVLCSQMTDEQRVAWRKELGLIILQGRAYTAAIDKHERENLTQEQRDRIETVLNPNISDSVIKQVKERTQRKSKLDKLKEQYASLGIDGADELIARFNTATDAQVKSLDTKKPNNNEVKSGLCHADRHSECVGSFHSDGKSNKCECDCHKIAVSSEPFDPSKLFG